jgi:riboflavin synthase
MFTGIIEDIGIVKEIGSDSIIIETKLDDIKKGDSIAVNGVCLTAISFDGRNISFDYSPNTDKITNIASLNKNSKVNLERALKLSARLGGHIVSGHIDAAAQIETIEQMQRFFKVNFIASKDILKYCVDKGSIAIDGISLTIADVFDRGFSVFIIPETFNNTIMRFKKVKDLVNIETDIFAKYTEKIILGGVKSKGISIDILKENGFIQ